MFSNCLRKANVLPHLALAKQQRPPKHTVALLSTPRRNPNKTVAPQLKIRGISHEMKRFCVIPDIITYTPEQVCTVQYDKGVLVEEGNVLKPKQVKAQPSVTWKADADGFYTLCMTDLDMPARVQPTLREFQSWLVVNIPGCNVAKGEILTSYMGAFPAKTSGLHRYVFLVYKQNCKLDFEEPHLSNNSPNGRGRFSNIRFAHKYQLGAAIAGNFFQAEWDEYVTELNKQLGFKSVH